MAGFSGGVPPKLSYQDDSPYYDFVNHQNDFEAVILSLSYCSITEEQSLILTSALKSNPSHLRHLNLSRNKLGDSGVKHLSDLLMNPQCKLEELDLSYCSITEEQSLILTSALKSNPSHLRDLILSENKLGDSGVKNLSDLLMNPQCKLEELDLSYCSITEKQSLILTSALKSNPSHLRDLNLSENKLGDSGVKNLSDLLMNPQCKLERLSLQGCGITDVSALTQSLTNSNALQFLKELDLSDNKIRYSKQLRDVLRDSNCTGGNGGRCRLLTEWGSRQRAYVLRVLLNEPMLLACVICITHSRHCRDRNVWTQPNTGSTLLMSGRPNTVELCKPPGKTSPDEITAAKVQMKRRKKISRNHRSAENKKTERNTEDRNDTQTRESREERGQTRQTDPERICRGGKNQVRNGVHLHSATDPEQIRIADPD
ncbi:NACHT, LRR and PYD domains-containing protein [Pimephales promelas]|nr:NACHT, LRR and PYD domains-containing protein [Pimephales promelas]